MSRLSASLLSLLLAAPAGAMETMFVTKTLASGASQSVEVAKGFVLVRVSSGSNFAASALAGGAVSVTDLSGDWKAVTLPSGMAAPAGAAWLAALPGALAVEYDNIYRAVATTNDPLLASQYALDQIGARQAWDYETGTSARITIAVIDSGVEETHVDLSSRTANTVNRAYAPGTGAETTNDTVVCNHGTRVAGLAAAAGDNGVQIAGVAHGAGTQIVSYRVFPASCNADCSGACTTDDTALIAAITRAIADEDTAAYGRMVINMSLGGATACGGALQTAVTNAVADGIVVVAASGNDGGAVNSPGNCSGVIPVGATNSSGDVATFSSRGSELASGGLVAPGVSVLSTDVSNGTASGISGTSFSAPIVAGAAALIMAAKPAYTPAQVLTTLRSSSDNVGLGTLGGGFKTAGNVAGAGRLNAFAAMRLAVTGQLADFQGEDKVVAFPNPFRADRHQNVTFAFPPSLQGSSDVTIKIYTMDGVLIRDLNSLTWNLKNDHGRNVASGTYLFAVSTSQGKKTGRISVIR